MRAGTIEWMRQFGSLTPRFETASSVDGHGNVYVAGGTCGAQTGRALTAAQAAELTSSAERIKDALGCA